MSVRPHPSPQILEFFMSFTLVYLRESRQKTQMKDRNGGQPVLELKLFHGTDNQHVDTICDSNLDWRLCGSHGTVYGKGEREYIFSIF